MLRIDTTVGEAETQDAFLGLHDELAVGRLQLSGIVRVTEPERTLQTRISIAGQLGRRVIVSDQRDHRGAERLRLTLDGTFGPLGLLPLLTIGNKGLGETTRNRDLLAIDQQHGVIPGLMGDRNGTTFVRGGGGRQRNLLRPIAVAHGDFDAFILGQQLHEARLAQALDRRADRATHRESMRERLHLRGRFVPLAEAGRRKRIEDRLGLEELLDDRRGVRRVEREAIEGRERRAAGHGVQAVAPSIEGRLALAFEGDVLAGAERREVRKEAPFVGVPAPGRIDLVGRAMDGPLEAVDVMTEPVIMADLVAELVAQGIVERHHAVAARAAMDLHAVGVDAAAVVGRELGDRVRVALLAGAGGAVQSVVGIVDAVRDQLLADVLAHRAFMPAALARIDFLEEHARGQHHFLEMKRRILADDEPAHRRGLEILAMRFGILGETERAPWGRQETQVDRMQQELRRRADVERRQFAFVAAFAEAQTQAGAQPFRRQVAAPDVRGVNQTVVVQLTLAEPAAADALKDQALTAADADAAGAIMDRRTIARPGFDPDHLTIEALGRRQMDVAGPATVSGLDADERVRTQQLTHDGAARLSKFRDRGRIVDDAGLTGGRSEIDAFHRRAVHEVGRLRQLRRRIQGERAELLAGAIDRGEHDRIVERDRRRIHPYRTHHHQRLAQTDQARLAIILPRMGRDDLTLGEEDLRRERSFEVVLRERVIEHQGGLRGRRGGKQTRGKAGDEQTGQNEEAGRHDGGMLKRKRTPFLISKDGDPLY